jgi:hypothetical protein
LHIAVLPERPFFREFLIMLPANFSEGDAECEDIPNLDDGNLDDDTILGVKIDFKTLPNGLDVASRRDEAFVFVADNEGDCCMKEGEKE